MTHSLHSSPVIRRVHLPDAQTMHDFVLRLSRASRRSRFHGAVNDVSATFLRGLVSADGERHAAWVACMWGPDGEEIVGEAAWVLAQEDERSAEFAISVRDDWQGRGVADALMRTLVDGAEKAGLRQIHGDVLQGNARMLAFLQRHGMDAVYSDAPLEPGVVRLGCSLNAPAAAALDGHAGVLARWRSKATGA
ncbi:GNAT family N-acetyltransferase [Pseudorhodoferax sp.]|uniref:GNAT family N-acetyltransferase n=1 Tax=Pseudorhodoferax sp. TaxID=1993553 RepID=UPI002DD6A219|nr:GNAT family N-acetyltransferase [Pseudorhodoferax sp.]